MLLLRGRDEGRWWVGRARGHCASPWIVGGVATRVELGPDPRLLPPTPLRRQRVRRQRVRRSSAAAPAGCRGRVGPADDADQQAREDRQHGCCSDDQARPRPARRPGRHHVSRHRGAPRHDEHGTGRRGQGAHEGDRAEAPSGHAVPAASEEDERGGRRGQRRGRSPGHELPAGARPGGPDRAGRGLDDPGGPRLRRRQHQQPQEGQGGAGGGTRHTAQACPAPC
ncbi:hypothetical protein [Ornithinimicrobium kibberense]|uniref:hypothetical protein n=1 Tax=Ornithinimicrobium kibberense TaxID=282060 RepID=UPI003612E138